MIYLATHVSYADADCVRCDTRDDDDMMHHLIIPAYDVIVSRDLHDALRLATDRLVNELDDFDEPDMPPVTVSHLRDHELNTPNCLMFAAYRLREPIAHLIVRRIDA